MNRKQRRAAQKANRDNKTDISEKITLFDKLPDECSACEKPFDKKDKQMAMTWNVVVKEKTSTVRLYCPECWGLAHTAIETMKEEIQNASKQD